MQNIPNLWALGALIPLVGGGRLVLSAVDERLRRYGTATDGHRDIATIDPELSAFLYELGDEIRAEAAEVAEPATRPLLWSISSPCAKAPRAALRPSTGLRLSPPNARGRSSRHWHCAGARTRM